MPGNKIAVYGADQFLAVAERFEAMARRARNTAPAWWAWADDVADAFREQFRTEGVRLLKSTWDPLSPRYKRWKDRHFPGRPILERSGAMRDDFTRRPMNIERVDEHSGTFGSSRKPAKWHQRGTRKMPARPIARATDDLHASAKRHLTRHIVHGDLP
jgi:hypothetical protein